MNKKLLIYSVVLLHSFITAYFWFKNPGRFALDSSSGTLLALGSLSGLVLASLALLQLLLMSRAPLLEQTWGLDKLARIHGALGKVFIIFLVAHPALVIAAYSSINELSYFAQYFALLKLDDMLGAVVGFWLFIALIAYSLLRVYKKLEFEKWYLSHLLMYLAVLTSFGHQKELGSSLLTSNAFSIYWTMLYGVTFLTVVMYRFAKPAWNFYKNRFYVDKIQSETGDVWSIYIKGNSLNTIKSFGGQFFIVRFLTLGFFWEAHPFSLSIEPNSNTLRLSIKASGDFTSKIANLKPGTKVYLEGPYGVFTTKKAQKNKVLLLAGGIGITPFRSMMEDLGKQNKDVILLYGNKTEKDIALRSEIEQLATKYKFQVHHVLSNETETANSNSEALNPKQTQNPNAQTPKSTTHYGFINTELISRLVPDYLEREVFVCGPPPMMNNLIKTLRQNSLPKSQLHFEKFAF